MENLTVKCRKWNILQYIDVEKEKGSVCCGCISDQPSVLIWRLGSAEEYWNIEDIKSVNKRKVEYRQNGTQTRRKSRYEIVEG